MASVKEMFKNIERALFSKVLPKKDGKRSINLKPFMLLAATVLLVSLFVDLKEIWTDFVAPILIFLVLVFLVLKITPNTNKQREGDLKQSPIIVKIREHIVFALVVVVFLGFMIGVPVFVVKNWGG